MTLSRRRNTTGINKEAVLLEGDPASSADKVKVEEETLSPDVEAQPGFSRETDL